MLYMVTFAINMTPMLAYIYHTWILWVMIYSNNNQKCLVVTFQISVKIPIFSKILNSFGDEFTVLSHKRIIPNYLGGETYRKSFRLVQKLWSSADFSQYFGAKRHSL